MGTTEDPRSPPGPETEPTSPTWAGGLPPTEPPGKAPRKVVGRVGILRKQRARAGPAGVGKKELRPPQLASRGECNHTGPARDQGSCHGRTELTPQPLTLCYTQGALRAP